MCLAARRAPNRLFTASCSCSRRSPDRARRRLGCDLPMNATAIIDTLTPQVPGASYEPGQSVDFATIYVPAASLVETCRALRDTPSLRFNVLIEVTAADYLPREPRFEVVYHLLSTANRLRLRVKVRVASNEITGVVPTVQSVWPAAGW